MKLIHTADLHFGSKLDSVFTKELASKRRNEVCQSFKRMIEYAKNENISVILLSGDVFDSDAPLMRDKKFFLSLVRDNPDIDFLYLRGNHDRMSENEGLENLKTFSAEWTGYTYGDVVISGIEIGAENASSLYTTLSLDETKKNIVMLHGQLGGSADEHTIQLTKLRAKGIDYLALGHVHSYAVHEIDRRGVAVYSGCLEGRGFDETGYKGFVVVDTDADGKLCHEFIKFSKEPIECVTVDITGIDEFYGVLKSVERELKNSKAIYRVELVGRTGIYDLRESDLEDHLKEYCTFIRVRNHVKKAIDIHKYDNDPSLVGEFVRTVWESDAYTEDEKNDIILYGIKALSGEEVRL